MDIVPARVEDASAIRQLLQACALPTSDLTPASLRHFLVMRDGADLVGVIGLDVAGDVALLRSLAVPPEHRGRGHGDELVRAAEALAVKENIRRLYLLTATAARFFEARGYALAARDGAPDAIRGMPQFAGLCPASSAFMGKSI